jgi:signal recognition particle GTPase
MGLFEKFKIGLNKSSKNFSEGFKNLIIKKKIDSKTLDHLEEF